jgi:hypothetical protein
MDINRIRDLINANAEEIARLRDRIEETYHERQLSPKHRETWADACAHFHKRYDELAFPCG